MIKRRLYDINRKLNLVDMLSSTHSNTALSKIGQAKGNLNLVPSLQKVCINSKSVNMKHRAGSKTNSSKKNIYFKTQRKSLNIIYKVSSLEKKKKSSRFEAIKAFKDVNYKNMVTDRQQNSPLLESKSSSNSKCDLETDINRDFIR